jgi:hypothetical protein
MSLDEEEKMYLKKGEYLRERARLMDINGDKILKTNKEAQQEIQSRTDPEMRELEKEQIKAEIEYTKSKAASMLAKAKKTSEEGKDVTRGNVAGDESFNDKTVSELPSGATGDIV